MSTTSWCSSSERLTEHGPSNRSSPSTRRRIPDLIGRCEMIRAIQTRQGNLRSLDCLYRVSQEGRHPRSEPTREKGDEPPLGVRDADQEGSGYTV